MHYGRRAQRYAAQGNGEAEYTPESAAAFRRLRHETLMAERQAVIHLRNEGVISDEVLHRLRNDPLTHAIPVVILSADANDRQIQRLLEAGAAAYLTKPLDIHTLVEIVDEVMPRSSPAPLT